MPSNKRILIFITIFITVIAVISTILYFTIFSTNNDNKKPNIIIIIADDMGWNDVGYHGSSQIPTPNLDALAYNGISFNKFYSQHICTPSRAALLTGNYPIRSGLQGTPIKAGENRSLPINMPVMPELFKQLGYKTHLVGKWHLGSAYKDNTPTKRGFDTHFGYWNGYVGYFSYFAEQNLTENQVLKGLDLHDGFEPIWSTQGQYATELFTKKSIEIIENHNNNQPLFLMLAHLAPHTGTNGSELGVPNINDTNSKYNYINDPLRRRYAEVVNLLDQSVGVVIKKLSSKKMLDNSIILFLSDNGAQTYGIYENRGSNWPLRGLKFSLHEGAVRTICIIYSRLLKNRGYVSRVLIHITDWLPTLYAAAGGNVSNVLSQIDGINQWDTLLKDSTSKRNEILLNIDEVLDYSGIITNNGRYKLLKGSYLNGIYDGYYGDDGRGTTNPTYNITAILKSDTNLAMKESLDETKILHLREKTDLNWCRNSFTNNQENCTNYCLYDLNNDPCETRNIIEEQPKLVEQMKLKLEQFLNELIPQINQPVDPNSNPVYYNNTWCTWLDNINGCFNEL